MDLLDPDLWDDDGKAKKPSQEYMDRLEQNPVFLHYVAALTEAVASVDERTVRGSDEA